MKVGAPGLTVDFAPLADTHHHLANNPVEVQVLSSAAAPAGATRLVAGSAPPYFRTVEPPVI